MPLPLLGALIPALGAGGGTIGTAAAGLGLGGITSALSGLPLIGGLFKKKRSPETNEMSGIISAIGRSNLVALDKYKEIKAGMQTQYIIIGVLVLVVAIIGLMLKFKK